MPKFHIGRSGKPAQCNARKGKCPLGGENEHYYSREAAQKAIEDKLYQENNSLKSSTKENNNIKNENVNNSKTEEKENYKTLAIETLVKNNEQFKRIYNEDFQQYYDNYREERDEEYYSDDNISERGGGPLSLYRRIQTKEDELNALNEEIDNMDDDFIEENDEYYINQNIKRDFIKNEIERSKIDYQAENILTDAKYWNNTSKDLSHYSIDDLKSIDSKNKNSKNDYMKELEKEYYSRSNAIKSGIKEIDNSLKTLNDKFDEHNTPQIKALKRHREYLVNSLDKYVETTKALKMYNNEKKSFYRKANKWNWAGSSFTSAMIPDWFSKGIRSKDIPERDI